jgi:2-haloacid dehalogenase
VLAAALKQAAAEAGIELQPGAGNLLAEQLPDWPVFPDVKPALTALKEDGWQLAVLSNIDRDLFAATRRHLPVAIDAVITAEEVQSYKPAPGHFEEFVRRYRPEAHLHTAQSFFHDVVPAHDLGIRVVWINRLQERQDPPLPDAVLPDLRGLPETVRGFASAALGS